MFSKLNQFSFYVIIFSVVGKLHQSNQLDDSIPFSSPIPHTLEVIR